MSGHSSTPRLTVDSALRVLYSNVQQADDALSASQDLYLLALEIQRLGAEQHRLRLLIHCYREEFQERFRHWLRADEERVSYQLMQEVGRVFAVAETAQADEGLGLDNASWTHANASVHLRGHEAGIGEEDIVDGDTATDSQMSTLHGQTRGTMPLAADLARLLDSVAENSQSAASHPGFRLVDVFPNRAPFVSGLGDVMMPMRSIPEESDLESDVESSGSSVGSFTEPNTDVDESLAPSEVDHLPRVSSSPSNDSSFVVNVDEVLGSGQTMTESVLPSAPDRLVLARTLACPSRCIIYYASKPGTDQVVQGLYSLPNRNVNTVSSFDRDLLPVGYDGVLKTFRSRVLARRFHQELANTGVYALLRRSGEDNEYYIVWRGVHPGVYSTKRDLVVHGLRYRGGSVESFVGPYQRAKAIFDALVETGSVETYDDTDDDCF